MTDEEWEALSEGLRQCSMHHMAGHANVKDPSMTPGTWPPHGELDHQGIVLLGGPATPPHSVFIDD